MATTLMRLTGLGRLSEAGAIWQRWLAATVQAVPELRQFSSAGHQADLFCPVQQQQQQHLGLRSATYQASWQHAVMASKLCSSSSSSSSSSTRLVDGVHRRSFSSCTCSHHSADSSASNGSTGDERTTSSSSSSSSSRGKDMAIVFTCAKCDTRSVKAFSKHSYEKGLVLVRCPGCKSLHLIADHLGWFGDTSFKIEEYMAAQGQTVKRVSLDAAQQQGQPADPAAAPQLSAEDLAGWSKVQQLLSTVAAAAGGGNAEGEDGTQHGGGSSSSSPEDNGKAAAGAAGCSGAQTDAAAATAAAVADGGVVQVAPEDVEAWTRVQQHQHQQG